MVAEVGASASSPEPTSSASRASIAAILHVYFFLLIIESTIESFDCLDSHFLEPHCLLINSKDYLIVWRLYSITVWILKCLSSRSAYRIQSINAQVIILINISHFYGPPNKR
jgi:hypothetical protein